MKKLQVIIFALFLVFSSNLAFAQVDPTPPPGAVPIDGGVGFLLAAGAAYGAKKIRDYRKKDVSEKK